MGHIQIFGEELREKLHSRISDGELINWVKEQVLKSYRNGLAAAKGGTGKRAADNGRRNAPTPARGLSRAEQ